MEHEILVPLRAISGAFEMAKNTGSSNGTWAVSFGPIYNFGYALQKAVADVRAPLVTGVVSFEFQDYAGARWANHPDLQAAAEDFWATTYEYRGQTRPVMPDKRAWIASRAWGTCRLGCARRHYPEIYEPRPPEDIVKSVQMQRPGLNQRAFNRLHDEFGYPRLLRFIYSTRLEVVHQPTLLAIEG